MGKLHHLNVGCADMSVIESDGNIFLIDCYDIEAHRHLLPLDKNIKAVFITHQHYDHFLGLQYLRDKGFKIEYLIHSPYERRYADTSVSYDEWKDFNSHKDYFKEHGSKIYHPFRQGSFDQPWWNNSGLKFWLLGPNKTIAERDTRELHDACLVFHIKMGERRCLFTGDASDANLNYIAKNTNNICNDILHASHHGSINGADLEFIKAANAEYTVISTKKGAHESVPHSTALKRYSDNTSKQVYRTDLDGNLVWSF